jgi:DNA topoisomerase IA
MIDPGFTSIMTWKAMDDETLPEFKKDQTFSLEEVSVEIICIFTENLKWATAFI